MNKDKAEEYLTEISLQEKQFDALYRSAATVFNMSDCSMWVLYYLSSSSEPLTQQDLIEKMMFSKQTINSAVISLSKKGLVELTMIPGTRNKKNILLTKAGEDLTNATVGKMRSAEERAVISLGNKKIEQYISLHRELYDAMENELKKEGIVNGDK